MTNLNCGLGADKKAAVVEVSNELEFFLHNTDFQTMLRTNYAKELTSVLSAKKVTAAEAGDVLELYLRNTDFRTMVNNSDAIRLQPETNPMHMLETTVSLATNVRELNLTLSRNVRALNQEAAGVGGFLYTGSSLMDDMSGIGPLKDLIGNLSESLTKGFMDITSQQVILGVNDDALGFALYNLFGKVNPVLVALSASSPYKYDHGELKDTATSSRRICQYENMCRFIPEAMWKISPDVNSMTEYNSYLDGVLHSLKVGIGENKFDCNWPELIKVRKDWKGNSYSYYPFDSIKPNEVYIFVRPRPDHGNIHQGGKSTMSIELRAMDIPTTIERMQMLNLFVVGLAYQTAYETSRGNSAMRGTGIDDLDGSFGELKSASIGGLRTEISGVAIRRLIEDFGRLAIEGLEREGYCEEGKQLSKLLAHVLTYGNDSDIIRKQKFSNAAELRTYLRGRLVDGERI